MASIPIPIPELTVSEKRDAINSVMEVTTRNEAEVTNALEKCGYNTNIAVDSLLQVDDPVVMDGSALLASFAAATATAPAPTPEAGSPPILIDHEDQDLQKALNASLYTGPAVTKREMDFPAGLKNLGNTCYFNSFLQALYYLPAVRYAVLTYQPHPGQEGCSAVKFMQALQLLFARLRWSTSAVQDPAALITPLFDTPDRPFAPTGQQDLLEFGEFLLERAKEGLLHRAPLSPEVAAQLAQWTPGRDSDDDKDDNDDDNDDVNETLPAVDFSLPSNGSAPHNVSHRSGIPAFNSPRAESSQVSQTAPLPKRPKTFAPRILATDCDNHYTGDTGDKDSMHTEADIVLSQTDGPGDLLDPDTDETSVPLKTYGRPSLRQPAFGTVPPSGTHNTLYNSENQPPPPKTTLLPSALPPLLQGRNIAQKEPRSLIIPKTPSPTPTQRSPPPIHDLGSVPPPPPLKHRRSKADKACMVCRGIRRDLQRFRKKQSAQPRARGANARIGNPQPDNANAVLLSQETEVDRCFRGSQQVELRAAEANGEALCFDNKERFETVQVTVEEGVDLVHSLAKTLGASEVDYKTPLGHQTQGIQRVWLEQLPGVFIVREQRVRYDTVTHKPMKINTKLAFDPTLALSRFMLANKPEVLRLETQAAAIQADIAQLQSQLDALQEHDVVFDQALKMAAKFCHSPRFEAWRDNMDMDAMAQPLTHCADLVEAERHRLSEGITQRRVAMQTLWSGLDDDATFQLYAVFVHQGGAGAGHYLAYIQDVENGGWHCYNDANVTSVQLEEVLEVGVGGTSKQDTKNAYMLMYIHSSQREALPLEQHEVCQRLRTQVLEDELVAFVEST